MNFTPRLDILRANRIFCLEFFENKTKVVFYNGDTEKFQEEFSKLDMQNLIEELKMIENLMKFPIH